jgi:hypothetical protein
MGLCSNSTHAYNNGNVIPRIYNTHAHAYAYKNYIYAYILYTHVKYILTIHMQIISKINTYRMYTETPT